MTSIMKTRNRPFRSALTGITLYLLALFAWAKTPVVPEEELTATANHARAAEIILHIIDSYHYRKKSLDDDLSTQILDNYLASLDTNRSFFTREDIARFEIYRHALDDALLTKDLEPAFTIFRHYRNRVEERVNDALKVLETEFDFTVDEEYRFDRRDAPMPDGDELDEIWRKRVKNDFLTLKLAGKEAEEIRTTLGKRYRRLKTSTYQYKPDDIFQLFINAYTTAVEPHTAYFSPRTSENFDISMSLSLEGIGAVLRGETDYTEVQSVVPGGPADLSGQLHSEDKIIGVGQGADGEIVDVIGWRLDDVVELIRGPKGTVVRLELLPKGIGPEGPSKIIEITRDEIKLEEQAAKSEIPELENSYRIGAIEIPTFYSDFTAQARGERDYKSTTRDVRKILEQLRDASIDGLIIDLRGNGGGSLSEALEFTGLFIETGPIVQIGIRQLLTAGRWLYWWIVTVLPPRKSLPELSRIISAASLSENPLSARERFRI